MRTIVFIMFGMFAFTACGATNDESRINLEQSLAEWTALDQDTRNFICDIYVEEGRGNQDAFIDDMIEAGPESREVVEAKVAVMEAECP